MKSMFVIKDTRKYGSGCYATCDIKRHETIHVMNGTTVTLLQMVALVTEGRERIDDPLQVGRKTYIDLDRTSRSFNHSCDPNAGISHRSTLVAVRDIRSGEEITFDYSLTISPTEWSMKCRCGTPTCRKVLGDVATIPKRRLQWYMKHGAVQRYMRNIVPSILAKRYVVPSYERRALLLLGHLKQNV
jgi:uncharacterized protein